MSPHHIARLEHYERRYGPYAFGTVTMLIIWLTIIRPELSNRTMLAEVLQRTGVTLENVTNRLENVVNKLDRTLPMH